MRHYTRLFGTRTYDRGEHNGTKYTPSSAWTKLREYGILTQPRDGDVTKARFKHKLNVNSSTSPSQS